MHGDVFGLIYSYVLIVLIKSIILKGRYLLDFFLEGGGGVLIFVNNHIGDQHDLFHCELDKVKNILNFHKT